MFPLHCPVYCFCPKETFNIWLLLINSSRPQKSTNCIKLKIFNDMNTLCQYWCNIFCKLSSKLSVICSVSSFYFLFISFLFWSLVTLIHPEEALYCTSHSFINWGGGGNPVGHFLLFSLTRWHWSWKISCILNSNFPQRWSSERTVPQSEDTKIRQIKKKTTTTNIYQKNFI